MKRIPILFLSAAAPLVKCGEHRWDPVKVVEFDSIFTKACILLAYSCADWGSDEDNVLLAPASELGGYQFDPA